MLLALVYSSIWAQSSTIEGFEFGNAIAPKGNEWESPGQLSYNKEHPHAWFFSFPDTESARKVLPENSSYVLSLDGNWKFNWVKTPEERPANFFAMSYDVENWDDIHVPSNWNVFGIQKNGILKYGIPIYVNQPVIFQHSVKVDDWRGGVMRTPPSHWTTYKYRNEVGSYRRDFNLDPDWKDREVFINFDGVDSFFYLWINGKYVGFSKNSRNTASFNITRFLKSGKNTVAAEVYRSSDGSFLEAQDMFRLPGIYRSVQLHARPKVHIRDLQVFPDLDTQYQNGRLTIKSYIRNLNKSTAKGHSIVYSLYENELYSDKNQLVPGVSTSVEIASVFHNKEIVKTIRIDVPNPKKWSAELPHRYTLVAELKDNRNRTIETTSTHIGFAKVEIKDTPASEDEFGLAGRYFYINGKTAKLKGVNRHETNPKVGHAITRAQMENEIMLMKKANINHVRNSHYPTDPYWYYLCNKYGIYLEDEANIESHQYYYGDASLSHPVEWKPAHVARVLEMVHANINHPSIVIWSLGNEAGPGKNFVYAYDALKLVDPSRPVQYERNNNIVDMGSNQYPSIAWVNGAVKGTFNIKYPFHISEYAHSMGNACGNLVDYWEAIESTNFFCGAAIWDWVDQSLYHYDTTTGKRYMAYGGDFGDSPNDGQFVLNGIVFADLEPKPQYYEVKKVYQHIGTTATDIKNGEIEILNKYYYKDLSYYTLRWSLYRDGIEEQNGTIAMPAIGPRQTARLKLPVQTSTLHPQSEYFVKVQYLLANNEPWAKRGYVQAEEQLQLKGAEKLPALASVATSTKKMALKTNSANGDIQMISGNNFEVAFDLKTGSIHRLTYDNTTIITPGNGPRLNALRAFVNNDNWFYERWFEKGLHNLQHHASAHHVKTNPDGSIVMAFTVISQAPNGAKILGGTSSGRNTIVEYTDQPFGDYDFKFTTQQYWTIYPDGSIELQAGISSNQEGMVLPRLGYVMKIPEALQHYSYYGRGPKDNYNDRKSGQFIELHRSTVKEQFVNFPKPQDMGNREEIRWAALTDTQGKGAVFIATGRMSATALPYSSMDMIKASHPLQLPSAADTYLHLDAAVTGLGGNSCGQGAPLVYDRVMAVQQRFGFIIRPASNDISATARVSSSGEKPLMISRSASGEVTIDAENSGEEVVFSIENGKASTYKTAFLYQEAGDITAWFKSQPELKTTVRFPKIDNILLKVVAASSQEPGEGSAEHLVDGNPNTIWHSMYSVTVSKHPHWVDFDAGEVKNIRGFSYLPRTNGTNGNVRDYSVHISIDGNEWGEPVITGRFPNQSSIQRVTFSSPVKGRYIRFTALSEQNGQDFASGAGFKVMAD